MSHIQLKPVSQQVVVVMGASSGIGRATAARFAKEGAKVVVAARGEPGLRSLVERSAPTAAKPPPWSPT